MKAIDRKLLRDLRAMRGQAFAIALVMACGVATFVMALSTLQSLRYTLETYYEQQRFAHVFARLKRAPAPLIHRIAEIPGVAQVESRIAERITLDMPGLDEPASGRIISLPPRPEFGLNLLHLRAGRLPEDRSDQREVLVSDAFAAAHNLYPGSAVTAVMNGRLEELRIAGIVLSPEFIYQIREGDLLPDDRRFGIFWMPRRQMEAAFDMKGSLNDVVLTLMRGASEPEVIRRLDRLTEAYGGLGAYGRSDQTSHKFISNELQELRGMTMTIPVIFLAVAAVLINIVLSRVVTVQREQIAALKALGYGRAAVAIHYVKLALLITLIGAVMGVAAGAWMGKGVTGLYSRFFHFPAMEYHLRPAIVLLALAVSAGCAVLGALTAVLSAARLPPAEAMQPQPPASFRATILERLGLQRFLSPAARMILREIERRPVKALVSTCGIALATSVLVVGSYSEDAINYAIDLQFNAIQRHDLNVAFIEAVDSDVLSSVRNLEGVRGSEPYRTLAVRLRHDHRSRRVGIMGLATHEGLYQLMDVHEHVVKLPPGGLVLSAKLAEVLGAEPGESVLVEVLEESRPVRRLPVLSIIDDFAGLSAYMQLDAVNRLMREETRISGAFIMANADSIDTLYEELKNAPNVAAVTTKKAALESFRSTMAENLLVMRSFIIAFAVIIAFGVVYNSARVSLSEKSRDLATLRVIGFTRTEISLIHLGELTVFVALGIPSGLLLGYGFAALASSAFESELFRIPLIVDQSTFGFASLVVLAAALASGLVVRRMLDRLDLVAVLKTRE